MAQESISVRRCAGTFLRGGAYLFFVAGLIALLYYWDPTRTVWKRLVAADRYVYEEIPAEAAALDPGRHLNIGSTATLEGARNSLIEAIWGEAGFPVGKQPLGIDRNIQLGPESNRCSSAEADDRYARRIECMIDRYRGLQNLAGIDRIRMGIDIGRGAVSVAALFRPRSTNGRIVLYHHGFAGTYHDQHRYLAELLEAGYGVMAFNLPGFGANLTGCGKSSNAFCSKHDRPLRSFVEPVVVGINFALGDGGFTAVDMIGFSAGAWVAMLSAAVDTRIGHSYLVAGPYPAYYGFFAGFDEARYEPMLKAASYLDMFVMASATEGRRQLQVFNRFDRCCSSNLYGRHYEAAVQKVVAGLKGGRFDVLIDESHARHKISRLGMDAILADLARTADGESAR